MAAETVPRGRTGRLVSYSICGHSALRPSGPVAVWPSRSWACLLVIAALVVAGVLVGSPESHAQRSVPARDPVRKPPRPGRESGAPSQKAQHPLEIPLALVAECEAALQSVDDYEADLVKRERIDGQVNENHYLKLKCRHEPFSVYLRWLEPYGGREVIYVEGRNEGNLIAHDEPGLKDALAGTVELAPNSDRAMRDSRHTVREIGIANLIRELRVNWQRERSYGETQVQFFKNAKVAGRPCTCIQVSHPTPRREFKYHLSRVYIDDELKLPIRFEAYDWPRRRGEQPQLIEQYTYTQLRLNPGLKPLDFDARNPQYSFRR